MTGTTTASVLTVAIYEEGMEKVAGGLNPMDLYRGVQKAVKVVSQELEGLTRVVDDNEQLRQVRDPQQTHLHSITTHS